MQKLIEGLHQFQTTVVGQKKEFFAKLARGQTPEVLFITCSDSRINPNLITQTGPGELFILRNAGNLVPPYGSSSGGEAGTIEYAISALKVKHVIVCGHSHCGAVKALLDPTEVATLPAVAGWLQHAQTTLRIVKDNYGHLSGAAKIGAAIQENVLVQLENLRTHPAVASALSRGELTLHGWVYKIETGDVFAFDPESKQYVPVTQAPNGIPPERHAALASI